MLSEREIDAAHPDAFDFVFGNLPAAKRADFNRHLTGCRYCQAVVDEYSEIGQIIQQLPPHVEPPADLEDRTVAAMVAALAEQQTQPAAEPGAEDQSRHPDLPELPKSIIRLSRRPGPADSPAPASGRRHEPGSSIAGRPAGSRAETASPASWSLTCPCGAATVPAWQLWLPRPRPSSLPLPSPYPPRPVARRTRPRPQSSSRSMPPPRPSCSATALPPDRQRPIRLARAGRSR